MNSQRKNQLKKRNEILVMALALSSVFGVSIQNNIMNVSADIKPIIVEINEIDLGIVFPGENIVSEEFTVTLAEGETSGIKYKIIKKRSDTEGNNCEESGSENCLPDLCSYIELALVDDEDDTDLDASLNPNGDNVDKWKVNMEVPAIEGFVAQSFFGIPVGQNGLHGCRLSVDIDGEEPSATEDELTITNTRATEISNNGAAILWDTNLASDSRVVCDLNSINDENLGEYPNYGYNISSSIASAPVKDHSIILTGLESNATYYCRAVSESDGKKAIGEEISFKTSMASAVIATSGGGSGRTVTILQIQNEKVLNITETTADFTWLTNLSSSSRVVCSENETWEDISGSEPNYGYTLSTPIYDIIPSVTGHKVKITELKPDTKYSCRVISAKNGKEITSSELDFTTAQKEESIINPTELNIFDLQIDKIENDSFTSSWKTNKDATTCIIYGNTSVISLGTEPSFGYAYGTNGCSWLDEQSINHTQTITDLESCTNYYYRAVAYNGVQRAISPEQQVKTDCVAVVAGTSYINPAKAPQVSTNPPSVEKENEDGGEVKEAETNRGPECGTGLGAIVRGDCASDCALWLLILVIILLSLYIWKKREDEKRVKKQSNIIK
jgi:hypothetical protein